MHSIKIRYADKVFFFERILLSQNDIFLPNKSDMCICAFMIHCSIIIINYMFTFLLLNSNVLHSYIFCTFLGLLYNVFTFRFTYAGWMGDVSGRWLVIFVPTNVNYLFFNDKNWSQFHTLKYTNLSLSFSTIYVNWLGYVHHVN